MPEDQKEISDVEIELKARAEAELEYRERVTASFEAFEMQVKPENRWYRHSKKFSETLERVAKGEIKRLMVFCPPSTGKSEKVSRLFPAYIIRKYETKKIGLASYSANLAHTLSRDAMDNYIASGGVVDFDFSGAEEWRNLQGGGMWATGAGGPSTGKHADILIIDDPFKNIEEAYSYAIREKVKNWWRTVWFKRQRVTDREGAAFIVVTTRWHPDDVPGWLLEEEKTNPQHWTILNFPELMEGTWSFPKTCTVVSDWRQQGEVLIPELMSLESVERNRKMMTEKFWQALCQQRPTRIEGNVWKEEWFAGRTFHLEEVVEKLALLKNTGFDWDTAFTTNEENSAIAYIKTGSIRFVDPQTKKWRKQMWVLDFDFKWLEFPEMVEWMVSKRGPHYIEAKASGKSARQTLLRNGIPAQEVQVEGGLDKRARALFATPAVERGDVLVADHLLDRLLHDPRQGLLLFPATGTDLNDVFVQAINRHFKNQFLTETDLRSVNLEPSLTSQISGF